jgi:hypothetical protein
MIPEGPVPFNGQAGPGRAEARQPKGPRATCR